MDLCTEGTKNVLRRAAKLTSRSLASFTLIWLSPECRILTAANNMNVARGTANGERINEAASIEAMSSADLAQKREELRQCHLAVENQLKALEEENTVVKFAMENPRRSDLWDMPSVQQRLSKSELGWRLVEVDQCAYGRKCQKPTRILTNLRDWRPVGMTGTGRCRVRKCGGTKNNPPGAGQGRHEQQMITSDPARKPREGEVTAGGMRREYSVRAGKNLVQAELVQEIVRAALQGERKRKR
jgi:hypothetical protein